MIVFSDPGRTDLFAVNVFDVRPENQQQLIDCITGAADQADIPGLLSMRLLRSKDGTQVVNFMHWAGEEALERAAAESSLIGATRNTVHQLIEGGGPRAYDVLAVKPGHEVTAEGA